MNEYKNKLLREKIESMKQLDRIELINRCNYHQLKSNENTIMYYGILCFAIGSMILLILTFNIILNSVELYNFSVSKIILPLILLCVLSLNIFIMIISGGIILILGMLQSKKHKQMEAKFIEEHTK